MQEAELVCKARLGDKQALERLLYDNYKIVYGYLLKLTMNEELAKDITQDVMVKAITHIKTFYGNSKFSTWLISIASNIYKDSLRRNKKISDIQIENIDMEAPENVEKNVLMKDDIARIKRVLMDIPEEKRKAFILKHYYSYSYEEISKILKCPVGTVRSRLHYCIKKLKELL